MKFFKRKVNQTVSKKQIDDMSNLFSNNYSNNRLLTKRYVIGDFCFTVGINRLLALDGLQKTPRYWEIVQSDVAQQINSLDFNYFEFMKENTHEKLTEFLKMQEETLQASEEIVRYLLPEMLRLGKTDITGYKDYKDYANKLLDFCEKNEILYDWQEDLDEELDEINEKNIEEYIASKYKKGLINKLMELIQLGFTQGSSPSKPKIKITEM